MLGVLNLGTPEVDSVEDIVARAERALVFIDPARVILAPDCGLKYIPRENAFLKLRNMCMAAERLRDKYA
jgi:5-methyltetrahydropteroyltriglutamate--homocysteine methyltransferase